MLSLPGDTFAGVTASLLGRHWRHAPCDERLAASLARTHNLHDLAARVMAARGIDHDCAPGFLTPSLKTALPDPASLIDMEKAALRIARAVEAGEPIAIFADYDVDGATSAALWLRFLRQLGAEPILYVPDRIEEGYGPNAPALVGLAARGVTLVVTVDCGVTAHESLDAAAKAGLDVVVIDHHHAEAELPRAEAVVNPNRLDDTSGLGYLCAAGVSYLGIVATNRTLRVRGFYKRRAEPDLLALLDLVALGTVCDVVPLTGLNRVFVCQGLKVMATRGNPGIAALSDVARLTERIGAYHLGFMLGPRINAGGRIGRADLGARLLSCDSAIEAAGIAAALDQLNTERRRIEADILACGIAAGELADPSDPVLVVAGEDWHPGVVGIVAARLMEKFRKPVCVIGVTGGIGKASGRSRPGIDLGALIIAARQAGLLLKGGGHAMAAGFTIEAGRIDELREFFRATAPALDGAPDQLLIEGSLHVAGATLELARTIESLGPFGAGHREPMLGLLGCRIVKASVVGETHVSCILAGEGGGAGVKAIAFRATDHAMGATLLAAQGRQFHLAGRLGIDRWQGRETPKFEIADAATAA
jgi:single-stranded-DNA-specific exonuclease